MQLWRVQQHASGSGSIKVEELSVPVNLRLPLTNIARGIMTTGDIRLKFPKARMLIM